MIVADLLVATTNTGIDRGRILSEEPQPQA